MQWLLLLGVLLTTVPFAIVLGVVAWADRRERLARDVETRRIAVTESAQARRLEVLMAVPFERPAVTEALLAIVLDRAASGDHDRASSEIAPIG